MEIILTQEQEAAIVKGYGSVDYLQTYCTMLADHLIWKQADDAKLENVRLLNKIIDDPVIVAKIEEVKAAEIAKAETKLVEQSVEEKL
jgi:hypothetical protein